MKKISLRAISRRSKNEEFVVTQTSTRIGSDKDCDFVIDDGTVPKLALTLEQRKGKFLIHNQTDSPVKVGSQVIQDRSFTWDTAESLQLGKLLKLKLVISEVESPLSDLKALHESSQPKVTVSSEEEATSAKKKKDQQMALIGIIVLVLGYLVYTELAPPPPSNNEHVVTFEQAMEECNSGELIDLQKKIQYAESRYVNGDYETAVQRFIELRTEMEAVEGFEVTKRYLTGRISDSSL